MGPWSRWISPQRLPSGGVARPSARWASARWASARWIGVLLGAPLALAGFALLAPAVTPVPALLAYVVGFAAVSATVLIAAATSPPLTLRALPWVLVSVALLALVGLTDPPPLPAAMGVTLGLLLAGTVVGGVVGGLVEAPGHLLVVAGLSALVDVYSVLAPRGVSAQLVQVEAAVNLLVLPWPMLGGDEIAPILGIGDVAFCALYLAVGRKFALSQGRMVAGLALGLAATLGVVVSLAIAIPALPFLGLGVLLAVPEARALPTQDRGVAAAGFGVAVMAVVLLWLRG